ncbi:hypothetical protein Bca4012_068799 [Brassica carinata]
MEKPQSNLIQLLVKNLSPHYMLDREIIFIFVTLPSMMYSDKLNSPTTDRGMAPQDLQLSLNESFGGGSFCQTSTDDDGRGSYVSDLGTGSAINFRDLRSWSQESPTWKCCCGFQNQDLQTSDFKIQICKRCGRIACGWGLHGLSVDGLNMDG